MSETDDLLADYEAPVDLNVIRAKALELRDAYLKKNDLEQQVKHLDEQIKRVEREDLPEMFTNAGISSLTVEATGNHPEFIAERKTAYNAGIPADKRMEAFIWMEQNKHGDLVKSVIDITLGMQEHKKRLEVMELLANHKSDLFPNGVEFYNHESVHHMTLKAFVKREIEAGRTIPMDLLGAFVFEEVKIK